MPWDNELPWLILINTGTISLEVQALKKTEWTLSEKTI